MKEKGRRIEVKSTVRGDLKRTSRIRTERKSSKRRISCEIASYR